MVSRVETQISSYGDKHVVHLQGAGVFRGTLARSRGEVHISSAYLRGGDYLFSAKSSDIDELRGLMGEYVEVLANLLVVNREKTRYVVRQEAE